MRQSFSTPLEESVQKDFKAKCKQDGVKYNEVIEALMTAYIDGKIKVEVKTIYSVECAPGQEP